MYSNVTRGTGLLEKFLAKQRANIAKKFIPKSYYEGKILDIGCGSYPFFLSQVDFKEKYALEKENFKIDIGNITLVKSDLHHMEQLPFKTAYFDIVTALAVIEHIEPNRVSMVISEVYRILKKDGIFIMTTPAYWTDSFLRFLAKLNVVSKEEIDEHGDLYTQKKLMEILRSSGFEENKVKSGSFEMFMNLYVVGKK